MNSTQADYSAAFYSVPCHSETLVGIHHPVNQPSAIVIVIVGGPQYRVGSHRQFVLLARALQRHNIAVFRPDQAGMGDAPGVFKSFQGLDDELEACINYASQTYPDTPLFLYGLCDGASAIALMFAKRASQSEPTGRASIAGAILVNPWAQIGDGEAEASQQYYRMQLLNRSFWQRLLTGKINVWRAAKEFLAKLRSPSAPPDSTQRDYREAMRNGIDSFEGALMIVLSDQDVTARTFEERFAKFLKSPARTTVLRPGKGTDHTFSRRADLDHVNEACAAWILEEADQCL